MVAIKKKKVTKYLKDFGIEWDVPGLTGAEVMRTPEEQRIVIDVENKKRNSIILTAYIRHALKVAKVQIGDPTLIWIGLTLKKDAREKPYFFSTPPSNSGVIVDIPYDPLDLLNLPEDKDYIGELYIGWVEESLSKLKSIPQFPCDIIRKACETFRSNKYTYAFMAGEKMIPGTRIKGRIWVVSSGLGTQRQFEALYRNKRLFIEKISEVGNVETVVSGRFDGFDFEDGVVAIRGDKYALHPEKVKPILIDFRKYPEAFELMREKGWVT